MLTSESENEEEAAPLKAPVKSRKWSFFKRAPQVTPQSKEGETSLSYRRFSFNNGGRASTKVMVLPVDSSALAPRSYSWSQADKPARVVVNRLSLPDIKGGVDSSSSVASEKEGVLLDPVPTLPPLSPTSTTPLKAKKITASRTLGFKAAAEKALLWVNDQHILVLDDTTVKKFINNQAGSGARFKAILVDSGFGHLTDTQWKKFEDSFRKLNLGELQEIVIRKQPKNSGFLKLLQERKNDMSLLQAVGFSEGVLDRGNAKALKDILKKICSLKYLSFGQMEGNKTEIRALYKIHDGKGLVEFTADNLREAWFPRLRTVLKA